MLFVMLFVIATSSAMAGLLLLRQRCSSRPCRCCRADGCAEAASSWCGQVWCTAIPLYSTMPALIECAAEAGWTWAYSRVADVGLGWHVLNFAAFMAAVEAGVYVMHWSLHHVRLYRCKAAT